MAERINLKVNGKTQTLNVERDTPLLYALRNDLGLNGPKFGCGLAQCGACTVLLDGEAVRSCITPVSDIGDRDVTTLEDLGTVKKPHPIQRAFIAEQAAQCGYCMNGMIMASAALLAKNKQPSDTQIREALDGNLCRCGTHLRIIRAVRRAAKEMAS